ncbi:Argonaute complex, subunit Arb1 [Podospora australis]|uniref:Argonaute complex, subunit Arb1 n=1 Tax=Podospora australis TaxID=1536484 RepID=A0AAN6WNE9_9PEZI|nr:Argonaute complex, subunit Arb1 [Podospora australis]
MSSLPDSGSAPALPVKETKKKKNRKPKKKATGFEEYFCDPPMTPAEFEEEKELIYPPHRPFIARIEEAIQRFRARRRLDNKRELLFSRYLTLGGVDTTVRQFQGSRNLGKETLEESSKTEIREMIADDVIRGGAEYNEHSIFYQPEFPEHWDVDFSGVAAGFLSHHLSRLAGGDLETIWLGTSVVSNFLKYIAQHNVCPEYGEDLANAIKIADIALDEAAAISDLSLLVPGHFNSCVRTLFTKPEEYADNRYTWNEPIDRGYARATVAVITTSLLLPSNTIPDEHRVLPGVTEHFFEVCSITRPTEEIKNKVSVVNKHLSGYPDIPPCGTMTARPVIIRDGWENSMHATIPDEEDVESLFVLEDKILALLKPGMKLKLGTCNTQMGFKLIYYVDEILASFYTFLPQELMWKYKEPVPNCRPGPSIHNDDFNINDVPFGDPEED